ncbi:hypothetical protein ncot_11810 [Nocardioides sp. JQ2195]|uniref:hypothetical protein n=1 Tax=Nocardioides sp. JQ2195 TaxID=2592334 RepID=UPI00143E30C5|nr:hypothetical protein [Nocardioides sp. JQ2195]QIX27208.1 hypothetical protein ncot_11810 [Nocardioides sp. JQ2195]
MSILWVTVLGLLCVVVLPMLAHWLSPHHETTQMVVWAVFCLLLGGGVVRLLFVGAGGPTLATLVSVVVVGITAAHWSEPMNRLLRVTMISLGFLFVTLGIATALLERAEGGPAAATFLAGCAVLVVAFLADGNASVPGATEADAPVTVDEWGVSRLDDATVGDRPESNSSWMNSEDDAGDDW